MNSIRGAKRRGVLSAANAMVWMLDFDLSTRRELSTLSFQRNQQ